MYEYEYGYIVAHIVFSVSQSLRILWFSAWASNFGPSLSSRRDGGGKTGCWLVKAGKESREASLCSEVPNRVGATSWVVGLHLTSADKVHRIHGL